MVGMPRKNEMILRLVERLPLYIDKANHPAPPRSRSSIELCRDAGRSKKPPHREPVRGRSPAEQGLCKRMIEPVEMRFASALGQFIEAGGDVTRERRSFNRNEESLTKSAQSASSSRVNCMRSLSNRFKYASSRTRSFSRTSSSKFSSSFEESRRLCPARPTPEFA
jgi:hypothetical protein